MSSNYAGARVSAMAAAGVLTDASGARVRLDRRRACVYLCAAVVALVMTRWLPVAQADE